MRPRDGIDLEWVWLRRAEAAGAAVTPMAIVASAVEADFYRLNNLGDRIRDLLAGLDPRDPDPDDLEELLPRVRAWVLEHALLEAVIDDVYAAIEDLPGRLLVRRAGQDGVVAVRGRPTLLAIKRTWADAWQPDAVLSRLHRGGGLTPAPAVTLVHDADVSIDAPLSREIGAALGAPLDAYRDRRGRLARLRPR